MRIVAAREKTVALAARMRNADIDFHAMTASALVLESDVVRGGKPVRGLAFDSIGRYGHGGLLRERFLPRLLGASPDAYAAEAGSGIDPAKIWSLVMRNEKLGGHGERPGAVGLIDAAVWDLQAKFEGKPLWRLLRERFAADQPEASLPVYASGGHYREPDDVAALSEELRRIVDLGYRSIKIKTGGLPIQDDARRIECAIALLGRGGAVAVDCNSAFNATNAATRMKALNDYGLAWIEEPVDPLDYALHADLAAAWPTPLATGENIFSAADVRNMIRHGGLRPDRDLLNMDISLSYGIIEYLRILDLLESYGWSRKSCIPHAGHLLSLHVAFGLGLGGHETAPLHDPLGGFPADTRIADGHIRPGDAPGTGLECKDNIYRLFLDLLN
jgi:L-alanine-DL-glutamate epimerase-like enolase superfamily enzyme